MDRVFPFEEGFLVAPSTSRRKTFGLYFLVVGHTRTRYDSIYGTHAAEEGFIYVHEYYHTNFYYHILRSIFLAVKAAVTSSRRFVC